MQSIEVDIAAQGLEFVHRQGGIELLLDQARLDVDGAARNEVLQIGIEEIVYPAPEDLFLLVVLLLGLGQQPLDLAIQHRPGPAGVEILQ